ncbi:MAG: hypothetical protein QOD41_3777, partial [Cryptosporangiaceae bacterium]|nr:hypothetical protein [Cryptosporangiaceae bacterium]
MTAIADLSPPPASPPLAAASGAAPRTARTRSGLWALLARLHFYAGILIAPFLAIAALTGLAYAFSPQLDQVLYQHELHVARIAGTPHSLADQVAVARIVHPEGAVATVIPPEAPDATTKVVLAVPGLGDKQRTVYVDPYSNKVRGSLTTWWGSTPAQTWLDDQHRNLHLGEPGRIYSELAASWLWVIVAGGLVLWIARRRTYRGTTSARYALGPDLSARGVRRTRGWHASVGVWIAFGLLFLSATGMTWSRYAGDNFHAARAALRSDAPVLDTARPGTAAPAAGSMAGHHGMGAPSAAGLPDGVSVDAVLAAARGAGLSGPVELGVPADAKSTWTVTQTDNTWPVRLDQAAIDPASGAVTARADWASYPLIAKLSKLGVQGHMGRLFGLANQLALAALALGLLTAIFFGYRMWWQRRPQRIRAIAGRAPGRGAWRTVP